MELKINAITIKCCPLLGLDSFAVGQPAVLHRRRERHRVSQRIFPRPERKGVRSHGGGGGRGRRGRRLAEPGQGQSGRHHRERQHPQARLHQQALPLLQAHQQALQLPPQRLLLLLLHHNRLHLALILQQLPAHQQ